MYGTTSPNKGPNKIQILRRGRWANNNLFAAVHPFMEAEKGPKKEASLTNLYARLDSKCRGPLRNQTLLRIRVEMEYGRIETSEP
ncbi:hypothetical protein V3C99_001667 [Haemonchus contortus]